VVRNRNGGAQAEDRDGDSHGSRCHPQKTLIEAAYMQDVLPVWTEDEAGPYQTVPSPGSHWQASGQPVRYPHEHTSDGMPSAGQAPTPGGLSTDDGQRDALRPRILGLDRLLR